MMNLILVTLLTLGGNVSAKSLHDFSVKDAKGQTTELKKYEGKTVLIVNVASKCGYTKQYDGLEKMYEKFKDKNLVILGFPCNQFGSQEPGSNEEIQKFCKLEYGVTFPVLAKVEVNGPKEEPLFTWLKTASAKGGKAEDIKWNFTKFLINKQGEVVQRYESKVEPKDIEKDIEKDVEKIL